MLLYMQVVVFVVGMTMVGIGTWLLDRAGLVPQAGKSAVLLCTYCMESPRTHEHCLRRRHCKRVSNHSSHINMDTPMWSSNSVSSSER